MIQVNQYSKVLQHLVVERSPPGYEILSMFDVYLSSVMIPWFRTLFAAQLSIAKLFRLWDILFLHGEIILFRFALSVFDRMNLANKELTTIMKDLHSLDNVVDDVYRMTDASILAKEAFDALLNSLD